MNLKFIFLFGLPGSGKTTLIEDIKSKFGISPVINLVDDLVQRDEMYKTRVERILRKCKTRCLKKPSIKIYKQFEKTYWHSRKHGCNRTQCKSKLMKISPSGCDCFNDQQLLKAFKDKRDIIFETASTVAPDWLFSLIPKEYEIIFFINLAHLDTIMERSKDRFYKEVMDYDGTIAPRLPRSDKKYLVGRRKHLYSMFTNLLKRKERIILYDNEKNKVLYDGLPKIELKRVVSKFFKD
jgi:hypothetical protein